MNERIKQLAEQCGFKSNPDIYDRNQSFDIPKFAELILQDCIATVKKRYMGDNNREDMEVRRCVADIQTHFGVTQSNIEAAESLNSDKGYSLGSPEAQEAFESKRVYKL